MNGAYLIWVNAGQGQGFSLPLGAAWVRQAEVAGRGIIKLHHRKYVAFLARQKYLAAKTAIFNSTVESAEVPMSDVCKNMRFHFLSASIYCSAPPDLSTLTWTAAGGDLV